MAKRIVTAREQAEMLLPWKTAWYWDDSPYLSAAWDDEDDDDEEDLKEKKKEKELVRQGFRLCADISDQPDDVTDDYTLAEFFQWCAHNHIKPGHASLSMYAQVSGMGIQDYQDISSFIDGMGLGGDGFLEKVSGKNGDLPELKYKYYGVHPFLGDHWLEAEHEGNTVGRLYWGTKDNLDPGKITLVQVHPKYRRRGIATNMVDLVRDEIDPTIQFSPDVSPNGKAWSKANGYSPPGGKWNNLKARDDKSEWRTSSRRFWAMPSEKTSEASSTQPWIHASPYEIPVGTKLIPGGGKGGKEEGMYSPGSEMEGHEKYVWVAPAGWDMWQQYDPRLRPYVYEVEPEGVPEKVDDWGWRVPSATVTKVRDTEGDTDGTMTSDDFERTNRAVLEYIKNNPPETEEQLIARLKQEWLDKFGTYPDGSKPEKIARRFWAMPAEDAYDPNPDELQSLQVDMPLRENKSGKWYHVSPHKMDIGTTLSPGGSKGPYTYTDSSARPDWVWMDGPDAVEKWYYGTLLGQIQQGNDNPWAHIYEVQPSEGPWPWNKSGVDGHVSPSAKIIREILTDKYNRLPDQL